MPRKWSSSPQRDRRAERGETGIDDVEQRRIFHREQPGEPGVEDIVDGEARLRQSTLASSRKRAAARRNWSAAGIPAS